MPGLRNCREEQPGGLAGCDPRLLKDLDLCSVRMCESAQCRVTAPAGVSRVDVDLGAQTVVVVGTASVEDVQAALSGSGRKSRLIGQGSGGAGARTSATPHLQQAAEGAAGSGAPPLEGGAKVKALPSACAVSLRVQ